MPAARAHPRIGAPGGASGDWEELFWLLFEQSSNPICLLDKDRRLIDVNAPAAKILGYSRLELVGTKVDELVRPSDRASIIRDWHRLQRSGEVAESRGLVHKDGAEIEFEFAMRLVHLGGRSLAVGVAMPSGRVTFGRRVGERHGKGLSEREREIVTLIALGRDTNHIAQELYISPQTVRTHVRNAMEKLGVHSRAQLVAVALSREPLLHVAHVA